MSAAERKRRERARRAARQMVLPPMVVDGVAVPDALARAKYLDRTLADQPQAVADAVGVLLRRLSALVVTRDTAEPPDVPE